MHRELHVVEHARRADLHVDRLLPIGDLAQLADLDREIVRTRPVGMPAGRALVDAFGQRAHLRDARVHLLSEQHAAAAGLRALADDDLDRVGLAHVVRIEAVARRQALIDERLRRIALLGRHAAVAGRRRCAELGRRASERFLHVRRQRAEAHPAMVIGIASSTGFVAKRVPSTVFVAAFLAIALQRIARQRRAEKHQVVEVRHACASRRARGSRTGPSRRRAGCSRSMRRSKPADSSRRRSAFGGRCRFVPWKAPRTQYSWFGVGVPVIEGSRGERRA